MLPGDPPFLPCLESREEEEEQEDDDDDEANPAVLSGVDGHNLHMLIDDSLGETTGELPGNLISMDDRCRWASFKPNWSRLGVKTGVEMSNLAGAAIGVAALIKDHLF